MSPLELIEAIKSYYGNSKDAILAINDLIGDIYDRPMALATKLSEHLETYSLSLGLCSLCGEELEVNHEQIECSNPSCFYSTTIPY